MLLDVCVLSSKKVVLQTKAKSVIMPGEQGVFEALAFHKPLLSRLISGTLFIDEQGITIKRGIVKINQNKVTIIIEQ